jgi:hypothetical protein
MPVLCEITQCGEDRRIERIVVVIAGPVLEEIAQYVQGFSARGGAAQEIEKRLADGGTGRAEVQVGDKNAVLHRIED